MTELIRMNENTWRMEDGDVRFFLFCGSERAALIDTGMETPDARQIAESLTQLPLLLINTHADPDHISGNSAFEEFYMSPAEEKNYRFHRGQGRLLPVREGDVIELGDRPLQIIDIPGHTPGSIAILDEKNRILISGDSVQNSNIFMFGRGRNLEQYMESLRHLANYDGRYDVIYPMHGSFPVGPDLIPKLLSGAQEIYDGKASGTKVNVIGMDVCLYRFPYAGFLCDLPAGDEK